MNMEEVMVSVVVPVYNAEKYLVRCIESIVRQSYSNLEIILVDDGSTDRSPVICDEWSEKDLRIRVIHKKNAGAGYARNSGMEIATGKYICFFDSDDYLDPEAIYKAVSLAEKEKVDVVVFGSVVVDQDGNCIAKMIPEATQLCYRNEEVLGVFLPDLIDRWNDHAEVKNLALSFWSCLLAMDMIKSSNWKIVSEREFLSEDSYSLISLYKHVQSVAILSEPLYFYCETNESLSRKYTGNIYDRIRKFYIACLELSTRLGYSGEINKRISGLFFAQSIGAMKQVVSCEMGLRKQISELKRIVHDEMMQDALKNLLGCYKAFPRKILVWAMRCKWDFVVYNKVESQRKSKKAILQSVSFRC